jgi:serine/threonine protein kinase
VNLPPELAERFSIVEELGSGGEGFVLLVQDAAGAEFVVKLYHPNLAFDDKASSLLVSADRAHVLSMEPGRTADGSRFEVLEWCEPGTLRDLLNDGRRLDVAEVVAELASALEHIHGLRLDGDPDARLVHQDLKPDNVMVRTLEPFDLVLGDFGLARMIAGSRHFTNRQQGSRAWAPPSGEAVTAGWDWWSLGMIVAEVAGGRHPFCVDGEWLSDAAISDHLSQSPVDLSDIDDDRVRTLCRGLLTRRTTDRWGASEVQRWLAGETVRVVADVGGGERRRRTVLFNGTEYAEPVELALALQQDWDQAQERLIQRTDGGALSQQVALLLAAAGLADAESLLKDTDHPPTRLANLLAEMNPDLPPIYRGHDIRPTALAFGLTSETSAAAHVRLIEDPKGGLGQVGVLTSWRDLEGMADAPSVESRFQEARSFLLRHDKTLGLLEGRTVDKIKAATYAAAVQPESVEVTRRSLAELDATAAAAQAWWKALAADGSDYAPVLALLAEPFAREQTNKAHAKAEAERQAAERKRQAERQAAEQARRDQSREQLSVRVGVTRRWLIWPALHNLIIGVAGFLVMVRAGQVRELWSSASLSPDAEKWLDLALDLAPLLALCLPVAIALLVVRRRLPRFENEGQLLVAQALSVVGTLTAPVTIPFGIVHAYSGARAVATAEGVVTGRPGLRRFALIGAGFALLTAGGIVAENQLHFVDQVMQTWPSGVVEFYFTRWPTALRTDQLTSQTVLIAACGSVVMLLGGLAAHASYRRYSPVVRRLEVAGGVLGCGLGVIFAPIVATGVAYAAIGVAIAIAVILAAVLAIWLLIAILDS